MEHSTVGLAEAIEALRLDILKVAATGENEPLRFQMETIELNLQATVTIEGQGKIRWWLIEGSGKRENIATQNVTIRLVPLWKAADGHLTNNFSISAELSTDADTEVYPKKH